MYRSSAGARRGPVAQLLAAMIVALCALGPVHSADGSRSVYLDELTTTEVRAAIAAGKTTVLIPVGGTEQSGPAMALGKHNVRAHILAGRIAQRLGDALVAPVLAYVPEGAIDPPSQHMRFSGTISVPDAAFEAILEGAARSLRQHGFRCIVLLGDHGGYQSDLAAVAQRLERSWSSGGVHVLAVRQYYEAASRDYPQELRRRGYSDAQIGTHAGLADTSLMLALDAEMVRGEALGSVALSTTPGVAGDPREASAKLGQIGVDLIVEHTVAAIRQASARP